MSTWEGGRKGGREGTERGGASCCELPEDQVISCCVAYQLPGANERWREKG